MTDAPEFGLGAAWRRGIMHAVERIDCALATNAKAGANARVTAILIALDELTQLQRDHMPATYRHAFDICAADHEAHKADAPIRRAGR